MKELEITITITNPETIKIVKALIEEDRSSADLSKEELQILDKLVALKMVEKKRDKFALTGDGMRVAFTLLVMAGVVIG